MKDEELQCRYEKMFNPKGYMPGVADWYAVLHSFIESELHVIFDESKLERTYCQFDSKRYSSSIKKNLRAFAYY